MRVAAEKDGKHETITGCAGCIERIGKRNEYNSSRYGKMGELHCLVLRRSERPQRDAVRIGGFSGLSAFCGGAPE